MKLQLLLIFLLSVSQINIAQDSSIRLELTSDAENIYLNEKLRVSLKIVDPRLNEQLKPEGANLVAMEHISLFSVTPAETAFVYSFNIEPQDTGILKIGPYLLSYKNKVLESNSLYIRVKERSNQNGDYVIIDAPARVKRHAEVEIKIRSKNIDISAATLKESNYYTVLGNSNSKSISITNRKTISLYTKTFTLSFEKSGRFQFSKEDILNSTIPVMVEPVNIVIE